MPLQICFGHAFSMDSRLKKAHITITMRTRAEVTGIEKRDETDSNISPRIYKGNRGLILIWRRRLARS